MKTSFTVSLLIAGALSSFASVDIPRADLMRLGFTPPESIQLHADELGLDDAQRERLREHFEAAKSAMPALENAVKEQGAALESLVQTPSPNADEAEASLNKLLEAEAAVKRTQLRTILKIHALLTPEQRAKALDLAKKDLEWETAIRTKTERLRTAIDGLGVKPTQAIQEMGAQIKQLIDAKKLAEASAALDTAILDTKLDEPVSDEVLDFSQFSPGVTELTVLQQRYSDMEQRIQRITELPLLRKLIQAHAELEAAKASQDASAVGRVLTWAEGALP